MFDRITTFPCIIPSASTPAADPRCLNADFALANLATCPGGILILKPSTAMLCQLDSIEFRVFEYLQGVETELTANVKFSSSDNNILAIGVNSGNGTAIGTGLEAGIVTVTVTHTDGRMAVAETTVLPGERCCDEIRVLTAIVVDNSRSMSLDFNTPGVITPYPKRLTFAKAMATSYGGVLYEVDGVPKDADRVWSVNETVTASFLGFSNSVDEITGAIAAITQTQNKTDLLPVFTTITNDLLAETADRRVLLLISDGEHTLNTNRQAVLTAAATFKSLGGIVAVIGIRASGEGFDLLERVATPGFFLNTTASNATEVIGTFNYLKSLLCAGFCEPLGDEWVNRPMLDYSSFQNWEVISGQVNLIGEDLLNLMGIDGLYVEMAGDTPGLIRTIDSYALVSGNTYRVSFDAAGNQRESIAGQGLKVYVRAAGANDSDPNIFETVIYPAWDSTLQSYSVAFNSTVDASVKIYVEQLYSGAEPTIGNLLDNVTLEDVSTSTTLLDDTFDDENLIYIPPRCGIAAGLDAIPNPAAPTVEWVGDFGDDLNIHGQFNYGITYLTNEGETAVATFEYVRTDTFAHSQTVRRILIPQPDSDRVVGIRIWRSLGEEALDPTATALFLLAEVDAGTTLYLDDEDETAFTARYEPSIEAPTVNTTAVTGGNFGYDYAGCCYYTVTNYGLGDNLVPAMTGNTTPSGEVKMGSIATTNEEDWHLAFDHSLETRVFFDTGAGTVPDTEWVQYEFASPQTVRSYSITSLFSPGQEAPTGWTLEGSSNESSWTLLDTREDISGWEDSVAKSFNISSPSAFSYYRITFTGANPAHALFTVSEIELFSGGPDIITITDNCPPCTTGTPGAQAVDPNALADIELSLAPPIVVSDKQVCVSCPAGFSNFTNTIGTPETVVTTNPNRKLLNWTLPAGSVASGVNVVSTSLVVGQQHSYTFRGHTASLAGSINSGTVLDTGTIDSSGSFLFDIPANAFTHYQLDVTRVGPIDTELIIAATLFIPKTTAVCATAATVELATAAANALLNCKPVYTATASYTAKCTTGFGADVTRAATRTSMISQAEALRLAEEAAQELAEAELDCEGSNNTERIVINDRTGIDPARATPYPSTKFVSDVEGVITKVTVDLNRFNHGNYADCAVLLVSPEGTGCYLMGNCMNAAHDTIDRIFHIDDDAADPFPESSRPGGPGNYEFTYRPTIYVGQIAPFPSPAQPPSGAFYETQLSAFIGEDPNGAWQLFILDDSESNVGYLQFGWDLTISVA